MDVSVWSQVDAGVAAALGAIVGTAAVRKLQHPRVFARSLEELDAALAARPLAARRIAISYAAFEGVVAIGVVAFRDVAGFAFACGLLVACATFVLVLRRAAHEQVPCACFGRRNRRAAGGREIGRAGAMTAGAAFVVVHRALDAAGAYGFGWVALGATVATAAVVAGAQWAGGAVRPGAEARPAPTAT